MTKEKKEDVKKEDKKAMTVKAFLGAVSDFLDRKITSMRILRFAFFTTVLWLFFEVLFRYLWPILFYFKKRHGIDF